MVILKNFIFLLALFFKSLSLSLFFTKKWDRSRFFIGFILPDDNYKLDCDMISAAAIKLELAIEARIE